MYFTPLWSEENEDDCYFKSEKLVHSYFNPEKLFCSYFATEKSGSLLFGDPKMYFTTLCSKEKEDNCYLNSENWFTVNWSTK